MSCNTVEIESQVQLVRVVQKCTCILTIAIANVMTTHIYTLTHTPMGAIALTHTHTHNRSVDQLIVTKVFSYQ